MTTHEEIAANIDEFGNMALAIKAERDRFRVALELIAAFTGKTLIAPHLGPDGDRAHQLGAHSAFEQAAGFASAALSSQERRGET